MADTIISNTGRGREANEGTMTGVILTIIVLVVAVGAVMMYQNGVFQNGGAQPDTTNVNVTVPTPAPSEMPGPAATPEN